MLVKSVRACVTYVSGTHTLFIRYPKSEDDMVTPDKTVYHHDEDVEEGETKEAAIARACEEVRKWAEVRGVRQIYNLPNDPRKSVKIPEPASPSKLRRPRKAVKIPA